MGCRVESGGAVARHAGHHHISDRLDATKAATRCCTMRERAASALRTDCCGGIENDESEFPAFGTCNITFRRLTASSAASLFRFNSRNEAAVRMSARREANRVPFQKL